MGLFIGGRGACLMGLMIIANLASLLGDSRNTHPRFLQYQDKCKRLEATLRSCTERVACSHMRQHKRRNCQGTLKYVLRDSLGDQLSDLGHSQGSVAPALCAQENVETLGHSINKKVMFWAFCRFRASISFSTVCSKLLLPAWTLASLL
jgi:hypothetical protein